jgi:L-amino acid N-acyltransferase YncA
MVRVADPNDAPRIAEIYNYYITHTTVTFEEEPISAETIRERMAKVQEKYPWLVYEQEGKVIGYAYAGAWKSRTAYRYTVETSVYLENGLSRKGIGSALYAELLLRVKGLNLHGVIGGMALPNDECIALHKKFGFEQIAHFKEVGYKFNKWIDVAYWERIL